MNEPLMFDASSDIEPTGDGGFALVQDGRRVVLSRVLAHRLTINVLGARRREQQDAS